LPVHLYERAKSKVQEFIMISKISALAFITFLAGSLAFAGERSKSASPTDEAATEAAQAAAPGNNPCQDKEKKSKQNKPKEKTSPSQEQQFDEVLRGIYG
jgi:hypothetical protein